jgi:hypothetical protein
MQRDEDAAGEVRAVLAVHFGIETFSRIARNVTSSAVISPFSRSRS